jgi:hypothetical protein
MGKIKFRQCSTSPTGRFTCPVCHIELDTGFNCAIHGHFDVPWEVTETAAEESMINKEKR